MVQPAGRRLVTEGSLPESVQDIVATMLVAGANITASYNDNANTLTLSASPTDPEIVRDTIAAALVPGSNISIVNNDSADTITIAVSNLTVASVSGLQALLDAKASASPTFNLGMAAGDLVGMASSAVDARLELLKSFGVQFLRVDMDWSQVQPTDSSTYSWSMYDQITSSAQGKGMKIVYILDYTPSWAQRSGANTTKSAPNSPAQFATFCGQAAARYSSSSAYGNTVFAWEIWNEPNTSTSWAQQPATNDYIALLKVAAPAIRAQTTAQVWLAGLAPAVDSSTTVAPTTFYTAIYQDATAKTMFDATTFHPYSFPSLPGENQPWNGWTQMLNCRSIMASNGHGSLSSHITEFGASTGGPGALATFDNRNYSNNPDHVDQELQMLTVTTVFQEAIKYSWIKSIFWYGAYDLSSSATSREGNFGLRTYAGAGKPAFAAWIQAAQRYGARRP